MVIMNHKSAGYFPTWPVTNAFVISLLDWPDFSREILLINCLPFLSLFNSFEQMTILPYTGPWSGLRPFIAHVCWPMSAP